MFEKYFIKIYLYLYKLYIILRKLLFRIIGCVYIIYHIDDKITNITLNYYSGYGINKYHTGNYYLKIIGSDKVDHFAHSGNLTDINKISLPKSSVSLKRKNIMLLDNNTPINFDLNKIDNYMHNMHHLKDSKLLEMKWILNCFNIKCTHIQFTTLFPFNKEIYPIDNTNVDILYH
jgi:hypothetical protein